MKTALLQPGMLATLNSEKNLFLCRVVSSVLSAKPAAACVRVPVKSILSVIMAPSSKKPPKPNKTVKKNTYSNLKKYFTVNFAKSLLFEPQKLPIVAILLVIAEVFLNFVIIQNVRYTEIDWTTYMQQVEVFLNGTLDYSLLKGDTGPVVYPAGYVYIFTLLYYATQRGQNIRFAQYIFALLYIILIFLVFRLYIKSKKVPPYVMILSIFTSYRIHSIFVLRMFNDPIAVILLYAAINLFIDGRWNYGSLVFSLAVSVKMNILLFAPVLLATYILALGFIGTLKQLAICAGVQLILGLPFLLTHPVSYITGAFDLSRIFLYEWTVNWRFLPEDLFTDRTFHLILLGVHAALLLLFLPGWITYLKSFGRLLQVSKDLSRGKKKNNHKVDMGSMSRLLLLPLFMSNLIGIACARSLHYQFYVWYYHSLPYLVWSTIYGIPTRLALLGVIELCWNTFPSTIFSSAALHFCHLALLIGLYLNRHQSSPPKSIKSTQKTKVKFSE